MAKSTWQTQTLTETYLRGIRGAIPASDLQTQVIARVVQSWYPRLCRVLDLGCGDGPLGRMFLQDPETEVWFLDFSDPMLEALRERLAGSGGWHIVKADFGTPHWLTSLPSDTTFDLVVSGFAIHHQPNERKQALYSELFHRLSDGGLFLNLDHVSSSTPEVEKVFDDWFIDHLQAYHARTGAHRERAELERSHYRRPDKKENILASVEEQCDWLRRIGYQDVDCFLKTFELALFGGRKAARPREKPLARESPGLCQRGQENRMPTGCVSAI
jgi:SAM-dependent methyltransferase